MPWFVTAGFWTQYDQDSIVMNKLCVIIHNTVYGFSKRTQNMLHDYSYDNA